MILLYGMPNIVAQGLIFVGFVYALAYIIRLFESLSSKRKKRTQILDLTQTQNVNDSVKTSKRRDSAKSIMPKYKVIIEISSDLARANEGTQYLLMAIKSIRAEDKDLKFQGVCTVENITDFEVIEEHITSYWMIEIESRKFDAGNLEFICLSKDGICNELSIYSASEIMYSGKRYKLQRIEDNNQIQDKKRLVAFDNWVNDLNSRNIRLNPQRKVL